MSAVHHHTSAPLSSADIANASLVSMIGYMDELILLYTSELKALEAYDQKVFSDLQPRKHALVHECEVQVREFRARQRQLKDADPVLKERAITAQENLNILALQSQRLCKVRAGSMARIQKRLLDAARDIMMRDKQHYNSKGKAGMGARTRPIATALNEAI